MHLKADFPRLSFQMLGLVGNCLKDKHQTQPTLTDILLWMGSTPSNPLRQFI
jgi:hypothetical protein